MMIKISAVAEIAVEMMPIAIVAAAAAVDAAAVAVN